MRSPVASAVALSGLLLVTPLAAADSWDWPLAVSPRSTGSLRTLQEDIAQARCDGAIAVPVAGASWRAEMFDLALASGTLYLCPPVGGSPVWASFHGTGRVSFRPATRAARRELAYWTGAEEIADQPITEAHFFTLRGQDLAGQLGLAVPPDAPHATAPASDPGRRVFRRLGTRLVSAYLDREGRSKGTAFVAFPLESFRPMGSRDSMVLYAIDPAAEEEVTLSIAGHMQREPAKDYRGSFWPIARGHSSTLPFRPAARALGYETTLTLPRSTEETTARTTIRFVPESPLHALRLALSPRLTVEKVVSAEGTARPFMQWAFEEMAPALDSALVVAFEPPLPAGVEASLEIRSRGPLIRTRGSYHRDYVIVDGPDDFISSGSTRVLMDEDEWYPRLDDPGRSEHIVTLGVMGKLAAFSAGAARQAKGEDGRTWTEYRTEEPVQRAAFYLGDYKKKSGTAGNIQLEVFADSSNVSGMQALDYTFNEIGNAVTVFSKIFGPLDLTVFRAVGTPTFHGRGFPGILLLSNYGGFRGDYSDADTFRAHEVAHQWWGNAVDVRDWPADRWIMESFAEYSAVEYYRLRFEKSSLYREQIERAWYMQETKGSSVVRRRLNGDSIQQPGSQMMPLSMGGQNVYTKGPLVLHMLRYQFRARHRDDGRFWTMLRSFLEQNTGRRVTTAEFIEHAERSYGEPIPWFWEQWLYGTEVPRVRWSKSVTERAGKWVVAVEAKQLETAFELVLPIHLHFPGGREATVPLWLHGSEGKAEITVPEKPSRIALNEYFEALVTQD